MITVEEAKAKIARGEKLGRQDAIDLLELQLAKKPAGFIYTNPEGRTAEVHGAISCYNLHPKEAVSYGDLVRAIHAHNQRIIGATDTDDIEWVPGCIVGSVFVDLVGIDATPATGSAQMTNGDTGLPFDDDGQYALYIAQRHQDTGDTWEVAIQAAKEYSPIN
jgi:hypothetical protein